MSNYRLLGFFKWFEMIIDYNLISYEMNFIIIATEERREIVIITIVSWVITFLILVGIGTLIAKFKNKK